MKYLPRINKMVGKQGELPPPPAPPSSSVLAGLTPVKLDSSIFTFRDKIFTHEMSLVDDDKNSPSNILQANITHALLKIWVCP